MKKKVFAVWLVFAFSLIITAYAPADDQAKAFLDRGISFADKGDYDTAIENFNNALRIDPDFSVAYYQRADSYFKKGDYDQVIADCTQAISLDPNYAKAYYNRGKVFFTFRGTFRGESTKVLGGNNVGL